MTIPSLDDLKSFPVIHFPEGNQVVYGKDFRFYRGIPNGAWYISSTKNGTVSLVREGSGVKESYGDGSLLVSANHILPASPTP